MRRLKHTVRLLRDGYLKHRERGKADFEAFVARANAAHPLTLAAISKALELTRRALNL